MSTWKETKRRRRTKALRVDETNARRLQREADDREREAVERQRNAELMAMRQQIRSDVRPTPIPEQTAAPEPAPIRRPMTGMRRHLFMTALSMAMLSLPPAPRSEDQ